MSALERYRSRISSLCKELLGEYTRRLDAAGRTRTSPKEFNDPVWGTLVIQPLELMLLDSPLFQRLRYIRQLGVVHWVYPAATHTRFEHTLGVVSQVQQLIDAVNSSDPKNRKLIDDDLTKVLRLAALCHDIGHGAMSHVSENALQERTEVEDIQLEFADEQNDEKAQLSEIAAFCMVGSPAFHELLTVASKLAGVILPSGTEGTATDIQKAIVGKRIRDTHPLIHELISGPFDADKLDYMRRDAQFTGVPVVTDIPRLIRKVRACHISPERLPLELSSTIPGNVDFCCITGIDVSGGRTLDELMLGRTLLFDKVYRHQKVRAAEALLGEIFRSFASSSDEPVAFLPLRFTDEQILHAPPDGEDAEVILDLQRRARNRELPVRALAFAQSMPRDPFADDEQQIAGLSRLAAALRDPLRKQDLLREIATEVEKMLVVAPRDEQVAAIVRKHLVRYIALDPPASRAGSGRIDRAFLVHPGDELSRFREESVQSHPWAEAYLLTRDIGYVFAAPEIACEVHLAAERVLRTRFNVRIPASMKRYSKTTSTLDKRRESLATAGYYDDGPTDLRPPPSRLMMADVNRRITTIVTKLGAYQGPDDGQKRIGRYLPTPERALAWCAQFSENDQVDCAIQTLEALKFIGRAELNATLAALIAADATLRGAFVVPLGAAKDSGAIMGYFATDIAPVYDLTVTSIGEALASSESRPIVFVDDFVGTGSQAISIFEGWLAADKSVELNEERDPLREGLQVSLRERKLGFVFAAGFSAGATRLATRLGELELECVGVQLGLRDEQLPTVARALEGVPGKDAFIERCKSVGRKLFVDEGRLEVSEQRAFGYGNRGLLIAFPYNVPTQTLTCIWKSGPGWATLLPRRKKG